jgi:hypothetical protein
MVPDRASAIFLGSEWAQSRRRPEKQEVDYAILFSGESLHKHFVWYASMFVETVPHESDDRPFTLDRTVCPQDDAVLVKFCNLGNQSGV